jgi:fatty acid-binding protein DegV
MRCSGIVIAKQIDELRKNGRIGTIRATGAVLIASVLLYFFPNTFA